MAWISPSAARSRTRSRPGRIRLAPRRRRSQKDRITWTRMTQLVDAFLPKPIILHPWPSVRFAVTHPRWEPYAGKPHVRFLTFALRTRSALRSRDYVDKILRGA